MKRVLVAAALCGAGLAQAAVISGFNGSYAVGNWTSSPGFGSISTAGAPDAVVLTGGEDPLGLSAFTSFYIQFTRNATVNFSWAYGTADEQPFYDPFGYVLANDEAGLGLGFSQLTLDTLDLTQQSGSYSVVVAAGQYFGFATTSDNFGGVSTTTINGLRIVEEVPEPGSLALLAAALAAAAATTRRRRAA